MAYVYAHYTADTNEIFYIGKGSRRRAWELRGRNKYWNHIVEKRGYTVKILHDDLTDSEAFETERRLITEIGLENLSNFHEGGLGQTAEGYKKQMGNPENRERWLQGLREAARRPEVLANRAAGIRKKYEDDPSYKERLSEANKVTWSDPERLTKQSERTKKLWENPEYRKIISEKAKAQRAREKVKKTLDTSE